MWQRSLKPVIDSFGDKLVFLRAEEHTAQIGDKHDVEDIFSKTEIHEMQFQDLPIPSNLNEVEAGDHIQVHLPPIDILSCTTTMEVGIDIGSLTAVALRTMPPQAANYQQRIGRAGRGSAEVSVAFTWADNSAYAQQYFEDPLNLIKHPETAPRLYTSNFRIIKRHLFATLIQLFSKRLRYRKDLLFFEGMGHQGNPDRPFGLFESLGVVSDFFGSEGKYTFIEFEKFCSRLKSPCNDRNKILEITNCDELKLNIWIDELIDNLKKERNLRSEVNVS